MEITINEVIKKTQGNSIIKFATKYGNAYGLWNGTEPQVNKEYIVAPKPPKRFGQNHTIRYNVGK